MKLSDTHLVMLSSAAKRADGLLEPPTDLGEKELRSMARPLLKQGFVEEFWVQPDQPCWWLGANGERMGLGISGHGLNAIGIDLGPSDSSGGATARNDQAPPDEIPTGDRPRTGTKGALVIEMLERAGGVTIVEIGAATGWQPHTVRAHISTLKKSRGWVEKGRDEAGATTYRLAPKSASADISSSGSTED